MLSTRNLNKRILVPFPYLSPPSATVAVVEVSSPAGGPHVVENDFLCVTVIAIFASVNYAVMPLVNRVNPPTARAQPDLRMSTAAVFLNLQGHPISVTPASSSYGSAYSRNSLQESNLFDSALCDVTIFCI